MASRIPQGFGPFCGFICWLGAGFAPAPFMSSDEGPCPLAFPGAVPWRFFALALGAGPVSSKEKNHLINHLLLSRRQTL